jgi:hypothetical protein
MRRWSKPQQDPSWLHGLVDHGRQRVQVDLVAQADAERLDRLGGVVLAAVEPPIHNRLLDAAAGRLEQRRHGQGRAGHRPARRTPTHPTESLPKDPDRPSVDQPKKGGEQAVDQVRLISRSMSYSR